TSQGLQAMHVDAGAFLRASDSAPVLQFDGTFRYDAVLLQVTSTNPPFPNGVFTLPAPFTFDVNFNEPIDPASVQAADLALSGIGGAFVSGVTVLPGNTTARLTLDGITAEGTLTAQIAAGAITDQFGNSGAAFFQSYQVDIGTAAFSTALGSPPPLGNLIYGTGAEGLINFAGDTDAFTLQVDAGQTLSVVVYPLSAGLQPTATIFNPANGVIASATAAAAGQKAVIQTVPAATAGTYRTVVGGAGGTTGDYFVQVILNEAIESEILLPVSNDTPATAQNIDGSFLTLQTSVASAQRGAVSGIADSSTPDHYSFTLAAGDVVTLALKGVSFPLSNALDLLDPGASVVASGVGGADLDEVINNFVVPPGGGGTYYARVGSGGEDGYALIVTRNAAFDTESNDSFATAQPLAGNRGALGAIDQGDPEDWYSLVVPPGQQSVRIETSTPGDGPGQFVNVLDPHIELYNPSNTLIASGTVLADGRNESISIVVPTSGTYRIRVTGEGNTIGEYFLGAKAFASVTSLSPAKVWIGLFNSDDVGIRFDLQATVLKSGTPIGSGVLTSVFAGSSGFNNAVLDSIPLTLTAPVQMVSGDSLQIKLEARNACSGSTKNTGRARLWYNGQPIDSGATRDAGSRFDATIGGSNTNYYLRTGSALS
ncbi:MAG TPA: Ig-like domain-containing protein, partial [Candidatus Polarisedimenticolia bacterium]|nr:Ig-like domain-containing protein [Candidatus Polarisedimenticolia bacterium]